MLAQIVLMAKLELFMGNPIYAVAVVLAGFLLANGLGSAWVGRRRARGRPVPLLIPAVVAAAVLPLTLVLVTGLLNHAVGLPVAVKAALALLAIAPLAVVQGTFYALGVGVVADRGQAELVPMTFGLATLSSVLGSVYAIMAVINLGFAQVVLQAEIGYALLAAAAVVALLRRRAR
jgi:hypothetical protein